MKLISLAMGLVAALGVFSKTHFHTRLTHGSSHELTWSFPKPVLGWGKTDVSQVTLKCLETLEPDFILRWGNAQTLKLEFRDNLDPGVTCTAATKFFPRDKQTFTVPPVKFLSVMPWNFQNLEEDTVFILQTSAPVSHGKLADLAYVEVEGLSEKVELDAISGDLRERALKAEYLEVDDRSIVLKPRRNFPYGKKVALIVPKGQTLPYRKEGIIREPFKISLTCERSGPEAGCSPMGELRLNFNSSVASEELKKISLHYENGTHRLDGLEDPRELSTATFSVKLRPETLGEIKIEGVLSDLQGRTLANANKFPLTFTVGPLPPLAKFPGEFGILEAAADPVLPITVRNLEKTISLRKSSARLTPKTPKTILSWINEIRKRQSAGYEVDLRASSVFSDAKISTTQETIDYSFGENATAVLGLPLSGKGLHIVELSSNRLAGSLLKKEASTFYVSTAVLVTNLSAHMKLGAANSLVWVTQLDSGRPVKGAKVQLYDCRGKKAAQGLTNEEGYVIFTQPGARADALRNCEQSTDDVMVIVSKEDDVTFTLAGWTEGIEPWRFALPWYDDRGSLRSHTIFDRPIYQQGETVQMLHLLREQTTEAYRLGSGDYKHLRIVHFETNKEWSLPLKWGTLSSAASKFTLDPEAPQGTYHLFLRKRPTVKHEEISAGSFLVKEFRVPLVISDVQLEDSRTHFYKRELIKVFGRLEYLAGGAVAGSEVTIRGSLIPIEAISVKSHPEFNFSLGRSNTAPGSSAQLIEKKVTRTGTNGNFTAAFSGFESLEHFAVLDLDLEYLDPNGIYQTNHLAAQILPSKTLVGIKAPFTANRKDPFAATVVLVDVAGNPLAGKKFRGKLIRHFTTTTRKKILGGFYAYDSQSHEEDLGSVCGDVSDAKGLGQCAFALPRGGSFSLVVEAEGTRGVSRMYIYGDRGTWEPQTFHDRADLISDKAEYRPGDTARLELKLPFEKSLVLVTKERNGVSKVLLQEITRAAPFLEVPIEQDDAPNVYVSALAVRGRLGKGQPTGTIDLSRPAFRIGLRELKVQRPERELKVHINTDRTEFRPRELVNLNIKATTQDGHPAGNTLVAVSVFDEGLLQASASNSFDVWGNLFKNFSHEVSTASAQGFVIGKRHFGLKAKPQGGGGGMEARPRELFDTLVFWDPRVKLDKNGEAKISFPLNDSLTKFRVRSLAYTEERFGQAEVSIQSRQELMTFNGTAPVLRTGDSARAHFTLKNIASRDMEIDTELRINGKSQIKRTLKLEAGASTVLSQKVPIQERAGEVIYDLQLRENAQLVDRVKFVQRIVPLQMPQVLFSDLKAVSKEVEILKDETSAIPHGISVSLSPNIMPGPDSIQNALSEYAYQCLEQLVAKAIILEDAVAVKKVLKRLPSYLDAHGFLKFYPSKESRSHLPLAPHLLDVFHWAKIKSPAIEGIEKALQDFIEGRITPTSPWEKENRQKLRLRFMASLKLRGSLKFRPQWLRDLEPPKAGDDFATLLDKWLLFHPGTRALEAQDLLKQSFKVEGSLVALPENSLTAPGFLFESKSALFGRFLLLKEVLGDSSAFDEFFKNNRGKFFRGYLAQRRRGHFGDTVSNTFAYFLSKDTASVKASVTGVTELGSERVSWEKDQAPILFLDAAKLGNGKVLTHRGAGEPWADIRYLGYTDPGKEYFSGMKSWIEVIPSSKDGKFRVQDRVTVKLTLELRDDLEQVGLRAFLPSGVTILGLKTELDLDHEERSELEWRGYFSEIAKGRHSIEISFRLNQPGHFRVPGSKVEALYSPELSAETPFWEMTIHD